MRPSFKSISSGAEFNKWYWLKQEMIDILKVLNLPQHGKKFELRDRIMFALDNDGKLLKIKSKKNKSNFNWAKESLNLETKITDNVSFGPNFRNFMKRAIGNNFSCHGDFMDWVKSNPGKTLKDAIIAWEKLANRKNNPTFRREIADHNMYAQYIRDFFDNNPKASLKEVKRIWLLKKQLPMKNGFVKYEKSDLDL